MESGAPIDLSYFYRSLCNIAMKKIMHFKTYRIIVWSRVFMVAPRERHHFQFIKGIFEKQR